MASFFNKLKDLVNPPARATASLDPAEFGYPTTEHDHATPEGPKQSIINLKHRLVLAEGMAAADWSPEKLAHVRKNFETLQALEPYWHASTWKAPPFPLDSEEEKEFETAVKSFFSYHDRRVETVLCAFGFLEYFSRGNAERRRRLAELLPDELELHRRYLLDFGSFQAEELRPKPPEAEDPDRAFKEWILPDIKRRTGATDEELRVLSSKLNDFESLLHALKGYRPSQSGEEGRENVISVLLRNRAIDPDDPLPERLKTKLEEAYGADLSVVVCKRCQAGFRPAAMKTAEICWGCWDG